METGGFWPSYRQNQHITTPEYQLNGDILTYSKQLPLRLSYRLPHWFWGITSIDLNQFTDINITTVCFAQDDSLTLDITRVQTLCYSLCVSYVVWEEGLPLESETLHLTSNQPVTFTFRSPFAQPPRVLVAFQTLRIASLSSLALRTQNITPTSVEVVCEGSFTSVAVGILVYPSELETAGNPTHLILHSGEVFRPTLDATTPFAETLTVPPSPHLPFSAAFLTGFALGAQDLRVKCQTEPTDTTHVGVALETWCDTCLADVRLAWLVVVRTDPSAVPSPQSPPATLLTFPQPAQPLLTHPEHPEPPPDVAAPNPCRPAASPATSCSVCQAHEINALFQPCGHALLCACCAVSVVPLATACPACRTVIVRILRLLPVSFN